MTLYLQLLSNTLIELKFKPSRHNLQFKLENSCIVLHMKKKKQIRTCLVGCLGNFPGRLRRRGRLRREPSVVAQNRRREGGGGSRVISLEAQHVLAGTTHWGGTWTCKGRRRGSKVRAEKLRFQQPGVGLVASFFGRRRLLDEPEGMQP